MKLHGSLRLRPTRIGFLVEPSDMESVRRIFQVCTCFWGGMFNPIIPVCTEIPQVWTDPLFPSPSAGELAKGYIDFFEPDVFVESRAGLAEQIGLPRRDLDYDQSRIISLSEYFTASDQYRFFIPFGLEAFDIYKAMYDREFKFVGRHERRVAIFEADPPAAAFIEAAFGGFPADGPLAALSRVYADVFDPVKLVPSAENWVKVTRDDFHFPLDFTLEGLKADHNSRSEPTLFVADPASSFDLIDLWNIRQFHSQILPVNLAWFQDSRDYLAALVKANHRPPPRNPNGIMIPLTIQFGRSIVGSDHQKAVERGTVILSKAGLIGEAGTSPLSMKLWYDRIWRDGNDDLVHRPQRAEISAATRNIELNVSTEGSDLSCRFETLAPEFADRSGVHGSARWVNVLRLRNSGASDTLALALPSSLSDEAASWFRPGRMTLISREGFVLPENYEREGEYFRLMTGREAIIDWLKFSGITAEISDAGRIAEQVLASVGGFWGAGLIADCETIKLLDEMAKSVRRYADGTVEEFPDRSMDVKRWRDLVNRRSQGRIGFGTNLDRFIEVNVFRLGLVLACPNCQKKNWFGIENLNLQLTCERCLKTFAFPQGSLNFQQTPWQYRVIGPYSVPNFAEGAYSTVLALTVFARRLASDMPKLTYATGLELKIDGDVPFEVDFAFWYQRTGTFGREQEPVLAFGEAKSFAAESFKHDDLARMRKLAELFPGAFIVFSTLKEELSDTEKREIGDLALWGREKLPDGRPRTPVVVLTAAELFCPWLVDHAWNELGGEREALVRARHRNLDNLWTLANFTQQIYLGLADAHAQAYRHDRASVGGPEAKAEGQSSAPSSELGQPISS
jgi:hypothetical protein